MNVLKTMKMNTNILVVVLLAYFLDYLSAATFKPVKSTSLNGINIPDQYKNSLVFHQPIKSHDLNFGNFKVNPTVLYNVPAPPSPPVPPKPSSPPSAYTFLSSIKPLQPSRASAPTTVPTNENDNHQGFDSVEEGDDYYYEEEEEEEDDDKEEGGDEEHLENSKTVKIPTQSKPTISTKVNNSSNTSNKFQASQPKLSSSTSTKPIVPESVKQENGNQQGFETLEGDDDEEEVEEEIEDEEPLQNSIIVASQPMQTSSISEPTVPESVNQENDNHQGFKTLEGDDYEEVSEEIEDGHNDEEYSEDPDHNTPTDNIIINGVQVNLPVPPNNPIVPQLSEDKLTENNYNASEYSLNTDDDHSSFQNADEWEPKSFNINNKPTEISKTLARKNDNTKDRLINTNEFETNPYDNTQISTDKQEDISKYQFENQYVSENKERIINGYKAMKKILYMLHDYASSTFNWIINKINYRMEQVSS